MSVARDAVGVCLLGNELVAVGGYDGQRYLTLVETYDPIINEWHQVKSFIQYLKSCTLKSIDILRLKFCLLILLGRTIVDRKSWTVCYSY